MHQTIGDGQFGVVYFAEMDIGDGQGQQVAIKTLKNEKNLDDNNKVRKLQKKVFQFFFQNTADLINEFKTMWGYGTHKNLIGLVGICATHKPYWLVMEYCAQEWLINLDISLSK